MNLYLIGYRGSGKSTVAPLVARLIGTRSVDTDQCIEQLAGKSICEIFASRGEARISATRIEALRKFPGQANLVVSLGGGVPVDEANREWIKQHGKTVWLTASPKLFGNEFVVMRTRQLSGQI